jgi:hypothetical protein
VIASRFPGVDPWDQDADDLEFWMDRGIWLNKG